MDELLQLIRLHGAALLFGFCLLEAAGVPIPAALALLAGGAAAAQHLADLRTLAVAGLLGLLTGDVILFTLGRATGWWLLGILCRISVNPESCILSSARHFYRRGRVTLLFAKFVPGLSALAAPLAGSMQLPVGEFLLLDALGASLYAGTYLGLGYLAGDLVKASLPAVQAAGRVIEVVAGLGLAALIGHRIWLARSQGVLKTVPRVTARDAAATANAAVFDVRSHGYYDAGTQRIQGAVRLDPNSLAAAVPALPENVKIYLYCTCYGDATSLRVAHHLRELGYDSAVIEGGVRAWLEAGLPVEPVPADDVVVLPNFRRATRGAKT